MLNPFLKGLCQHLELGPKFLLCAKHGTNLASESLATEAIITADVWEKVQVLRKNKRRPTRKGKTNLFSDVSYCADYSRKLYYCISKSFETRQDHFVCSTSRLKGVETCSTHFIRAVVLEEMVLWHLQYITSFVTAYEDIFREKMNAKYTTDRKQETALRRKQIAQAERRISELSKLFKRMYEDNVNGKLNDIRFEELSAYFEEEQTNLENKLRQWQSELNTLANEEMA